MKHRHIDYRHEAEKWEQAKLRGSDSVLNFCQQKLRHEKWDWFALDLALTRLKLDEEEARKIDLQLILAAITFYRRITPLMKSFDEKIENLRKPFYKEADSNQP